MAPDSRRTATRSFQPWIGLGILLIALSFILSWKEAWIFVAVGFTSALWLFHGSSRKPDENLKTDSSANTETDDGDDSGSRLRIFEVLLAAFALGLGVSWATWGFLGSEQAVSMYDSVPYVNHYDLRVWPTSNQLRRFKIKEEIHVVVPSPDSLRASDTMIMTPPPDTIDGEERGQWMVQELVVHPLVSLPAVTRTESGLLITDLALCRDVCPSASIQLRDFPLKTFYRAQGAMAEVIPYIDTERVQWSIPHLDEPIQFTYLTGIWRHARVLFRPVEWVSSRGQVFAFGVTALLSFIAASLLNAWLATKFRAFFGNGS